MTTWTMTALRPARLLNLNDRVTTKLQRIDNHGAKAEWRDGVFYHAKQHRPLPKITGLATVLVEFGTDRPNHRRDPSNFAATMKPILDGLTLAGLWTDDDSKHVATLEPRFVTDIPKTHYRVTITWEDQ